MRFRSLVVALGLLAGPQGAAALSVGVVGDSLSDEYQTTLHTLAAPPPGAPPPGTAVRYEGFGWVEQLAALRGVDFGAFEPDPGARSDSRFDGYAQNWALKGQRALAGTLLEFVNPIFLGQTLPAQVAGLEAQITAGDVDVAVVMIGGNDIFWRLLTGGSFDLADAGFQAFRDDLVTAVADAATVLSAAGAPVVIGGIPFVADLLGPVDPALAAINTALLAALPAGAVLVDPYAELNARSTGTGFFVGSEFIAFGAAPSGLLVPVGDPAAVDPSQCGFAGTILPALVLGPEGCPTAAYQRFHLTDDGIHPTTVSQGLMANALIAGINSQVAPADQLALLSDAEILTIAGLPEPGPAALVATGLAGLAAARERRRR